VTRERDRENDDFKDESCRLKDGLNSCRKLVANYRAMLTDSSNDNPADRTESESRMA